MRTVLMLLTAASTLAAQEPISKSEYAARRDSLAARIGTGAVIAFGGVTPTTDYGTFYQLPAFNYLTGYQLADAALVMIVQAGKPASTTLFINRTAPRRSIYYGAEPDSATLASTLGLASRPIGDITRVADSIAEMGYPIYHVRDFRAADFAGQDSLTKGAQFIKALAARNPGLKVHDAHPLVNALRARKSEAELALIRKAAEISAEGHKELMRKATEGAAEYDYQAIIEGAFLRGGAERPAYGAIVGSGPLSSQLHYMKNRRRFEPGDVVVVDAAAEYHGYAADVTRTIPVSGTFTEEQRAIYRLVRDAQAAAERNAKAGMPFAASTDSSVAVRAKGLAKLGLVEAEDATYDPPWEVDCAKTAARLPAGVHLDDSRDHPRPGPRGARPDAGLHLRHLPGRRRLHHRAGDLHQPQVPRHAARHAEEPCLHREGPAGRPALRQRRRAHRGRVRPHRPKVWSGSAGCHAISRTWKR